MGPVAWGYAVGGGVEYLFSFASPAETMNLRDSHAELLQGAARDALRARRQAVGWGVASGFFAALVGYSLTGSSWWLLSPWVGFALAWRLVMGHWPFFGPARR